MTTLLKSIAATVLTCSIVLTASTASAESLFSIGSRFSLEFEDSLFTGTSRNNLEIYDDQLYRDGNIRKGNVMHTVLDLGYHYAIRKMRKKANTNALNAGPQRTHEVRSGFKTSYRLKVSSSKMVFGVKYRF